MGATVGVLALCHQQEVHPRPRGRDIFKQATAIAAIYSLASDAFYKILVQHVK